MLASTGGEAKETWRPVVNGGRELVSMCNPLWLATVWVNVVSGAETAGSELLRELRRKGLVDIQMRIKGTIHGLLEVLPWSVLCSK